MNLDAFLEELGRVTLAQKLEWLDVLSPFFGARRLRVLIDDHLLCPITALARLRGDSNITGASQVFQAADALQLLDADTDMLTSVIDDFGPRNDRDAYDARLGRERVVLKRRLVKAIGGVCGQTSMVDLFGQT